MNRQKGPRQQFEDKKPTLWNRGQDQQDRGTRTLTLKGAAAAGEPARLAGARPINEKTAFAGTRTLEENEKRDARLTVV